jgi:hypothetical protein
MKQKMKDLIQSHHFLSDIVKDLTQMKNTIVEKSKSYVSAFTSLLFTSKQTGVSRKELSTWNKADLLPYKIIASIKNAKAEYLKSTIYWRRYSLIECIWIKVIVKLKKYGIQDAIIFDLCSQLFQKVDSIEENDSTLSPEEIKIHKLQESHFGKFLMHATMYHIDFSILVSEDGEFAIIDHDSESANNIYRAYRDKTYLTINVSSLMKSFIASDDVNMDSDYYVSLLHPNEKEIIKKIKENAFKQVTLSLKDGSITHFRISKDKKANNETIKSIARMLKKEDYQSIQCAAIDDTVVTFEEEALTSLV